MQARIRTVLFMLTSMAGIQGDLEASDSLMRIAGRAEAHRRFDVIEKILAAVGDSPFDHIKSRADYYGALLRFRRGVGFRAGAVGEFERLASIGDSETRARSLLSLGASAFHAGEPENAMAYYHEAGRFVSRENPLLGLHVCKMNAAALSLAGRNREAMRLLDDIAPLAGHLQRVETVGYLDYLNSRTLVAAALGRFSEAQAAGRFLARFGHLFPVGAETAREVDEMRAARFRWHGVRIEFIVPPVIPEPENVMIFRPRAESPSDETERQAERSAIIDASLPVCSVPLDRLTPARVLMTRPVPADTAGTISELLSPDVPEESKALARRALKFRGEDALYAHRMFDGIEESPMGIRRKGKSKKGGAKLKLAQ